jgi:hypothetical protein
VTQISQKTFVGKREFMPLFCLLNTNLISLFADPALKRQIHLHSPPIGPIKWLVKATEDEWKSVDEAPDSKIKLINVICNR